ncbi:MAG: lipocalin family protein [Spirosomataceae bacterium]
MRTHLLPTTRRRLAFSSNLVYGVLLLFVLSLAACQPKTVAPISDLIGKIWKVQSVKENSVQVYAAGATNNIRPSYINFRLDLSKTSQVTFIDLDGRKTIGTWSLSTDNQRLILQNLVPQPSETNGNIEFYIKSITENNLELERTAESRKTGNSLNEYSLIPE